MLCDLRSYRWVHWEAARIGKSIELGNLQRWLPPDGSRAQLSAYIQQSLTIPSQEVPETVINLYNIIQDVDEKLPEDLIQDLKQINQDQYAPSMYLDGTFVEDLTKKRITTKAMEMKSSKPFTMFDYYTKMEAVQVPNVHSMTLIDIFDSLLRYDMKQSTYNAYEHFCLHLQNLMKRAIAGNEIKETQEQLMIASCDPKLMASLSSSKQFYDLLPRHRKRSCLASEDIFTRPGKVVIAKQDLHEYYYGDNERPKKQHRSLSPITAPSKITFISKPQFPDPKEETFKHSMSALHNFFLPNLQSKLSDPDNEFIADGSEKGQKWILEQHKMTEDGLDRAERYQRMLTKLTLSDESVWVNDCLNDHQLGPNFMCEDYSQLFFDVQWRADDSDLEAIKSQKERLNEIMKEHDGIRKEKSMGIVCDPSVPLMHVQVVADPIKEVNNDNETLPKTHEKASEMETLQDVVHQSLPEPAAILSSEPDPKDASCPTSEIFTDV